MSGSARPNNSPEGSSAASIGLRADPSCDDEDLLRRFVEASDRAALGELAQRYEPYLLGVAMGLLGGREDRARDAVQEVWVRVIRSAATFRFDSSVKTWLYRITVNRCRDEHRRAKVGARSAISLNGVLGQEEHAASATLADRDEIGSVIHALDGMEFGVEGKGGSGGGGRDGRVRGAVDRLSAEEREVVVLCFHRGLSHTEAAAALDLPMGTLKTRLYRAIKRLGTMLNSGAVQQVGKERDRIDETKIDQRTTRQATESGG